jgi:hypothetical protein
MVPSISKRSLLPQLPSLLTVPYNVKQLLHDLVQYTLVSHSQQQDMGGWGWRGVGWGWFEGRRVARWGRVEVEIASSTDVDAICKP